MNHRPCRTAARDHGRQHRRRAARWKVPIGPAGRGLSPRPRARPSSPPRSVPRHHLGVVDHQHVTGIEQLGQVGHRPVVGRTARTAVHQQAGRVARLDRVLGDGPRRQRVVEVGGVHGSRQVQVGRQARPEVIGLAGLRGRPGPRWRCRPATRAGGSGRPPRRHDPTLATTRAGEPRWGSRWRRCRSGRSVEVSRRGRRVGPCRGTSRAAYDRCGPRRRGWPPGPGGCA